MERAKIHWFFYLPSGPKCSVFYSVTCNCASFFCFLSLLFPPFQMVFFFLISISQLSSSFFFPFPCVSIEYLPYVLLYLGRDKEEEMKKAEENTNIHLENACHRDTHK